MKELEKIIDEIKGNLYIERSITNNKRIKSIEERLKNKEFKISVVGEFSSGKSTLINAILGRDLLKHATIETTATITKIYNEKKEQKLIINYLNGEIKEEKNIELLKEYTTTKSKENLVNIIESVEIHTDYFKGNEDLVIIDTPGLNGIADKHREKTVEEVKRSHACIYVFQKNGISDSDREFIRFLLNYQNNFIFVQNFIDELRKSEGDTKEKKLISIENGLSNLFSDNKGQVTYKVIGISALKGLASREREINKLYESDILTLTDERRRELLKESNIEELENEINILIRSEKENKIKEKVTLHSLEVFLDEVIKREEDIQEKNKERLMEDLAYRDLEKGKRRINELEEREGEIIKSLNNLIEAEFIRYKRILNKNIDENIEKINYRITNKIDQENNYDEFVRKINTEYFINEIEREIDEYKSDLEENEYFIIQDIFRNILSRLSEYSKFSTEGISELKEVTLKPLKIKELNYDLRGKEREIQKDRQELIFQNLTFRENTIERERLIKEENYERERYIIAEIKKKRAEIYKRRNEASLGAIPRLENKRRVEWEKNRRNIEIKYIQEKKEIEREMTLIKKRLMETENLKDSKELILESTKRKMEFLKSQILTKEEELKIYELRAKKEYLLLRKKQFKDSLEGYLFGDSEGEKGVCLTLKEKINEDLFKNKDRILEEALEECKRVIKDEIVRIDTLIKENFEIGKITERYEREERELLFLKDLLKGVKEIKI